MNRSVYFKSLSLSLTFNLPYDTIENDKNFIVSKS